MSPWAVDIANASATVDVSVDVTDDISGVNDVTVWLVSPTGATVYGASIYGLVGTIMDGTWSGTLSVPRYSVTGDYTVRVGVNDKAGNLTYLDNVDTMFGDDFSVTATPVSDTTAPTITSISLSPWTADVTSGAVSVTLEVGVADDLSGVDSGYVVLRNPAEESVQVLTLTRTAGDALSGTYSTTLTVPALAGPGDQAQNEPNHQSRGQAVRKRLHRHRWCGVKFAARCERRCPYGNRGRHRHFRSRAIAGQ